MPVHLPPPSRPEPLPGDPPALVAPAPVPQGPAWRSEDLLAGTDEALINHGDQVYRLRRTGTGKLILTK